jgi:hypothetical protein
MAHRMLPPRALIRRIRALIRRIEEDNAARRESTVNAQCRCDEVRRLARGRGTAAERGEYVTASIAWREAGQPDVPSITLWWRSDREPGTTISSTMTTTAQSVGAGDGQ